MSKSAEHIDKLLFDFCENNLSEAEKSALLSLLEKNGIQNEDLELWQSIRFEESLPDTSEFEKEILARTSDSNQKWIYSSSLTGEHLVGFYGL